MSTDDKIRDEKLQYDTGFQKIQNKIIQKQLQLSIIQNYLKKYIYIYIYIYIYAEERQKIIDNLRLI